MDVRIGNATECKHTVEVVLADANGDAPAEGTKVLLDIASVTDGAENANFIKVIEAHDNFVTADKGDSELFGALVKTIESASEAGTFTFTLDADQIASVEHFAGIGISVVQVGHCMYY